MWLTVVKQMIYYCPILPQRKGTPGSNFTNKGSPTAPFILTRCDVVRTYGHRKLFLLPEWGLIR